MRRNRGKGTLFLESPGATGGILDTMNARHFFLTTICAGVAMVGPAPGDLQTRDARGEYLDVLSGDKVLARYMYAHDTSSEERHHATYKPYLHVFDAEGGKPITKGPGGKFTHHRGIFIGWNRIGFKGKTYDRWHMKGGDIIHREFRGGPVADDQAAIVSETQWMGAGDEVILDEVRTMVVKEGRDGGMRMVIDFTSVLTATNGEVVLKGDPEHAGVQYRPANEVDAKKTRYVFPEGVADVRKERDLPWVGESYTLDGKRHSVVQLNHPANPKDTRHSAYRDYGRFGAFFETTVPEGESLTVRYRFLVIDGEMPERAMIDRAWKAYADTK